jgi:NitT/TauT family transport system substrate-binding protein
MTLRGTGAMRRVRALGVGALVAAVALTAFGGSAAGAPAKHHRAMLDTITLDTLPISNALPLTLGINKGYFAKQGIEIKVNVLQSGNDIVLALANKQADIGYVGYVPMMIAATTGIDVSLVAASEVEGTSADDNWQNIMVKGNSAIKTPADLAGKTIAVNALKGVGETIIKAALDKLGVDPNSIKLTPLPFPSMRAALNNGQVDAIWAPEPFVSQALNLDGDRIVMAPGPVVGKYFPNGGYVALRDWTTHHPGLAKRFRTAMNISLLRAQKHPEDIRPLLPAGTGGIRLPIWSPLIDRKQIPILAKAALKYGVIASMPNFARVFPPVVKTGVIKAKPKKKK